MASIAAVKRDAAKIAEWSDRLDDDLKAAYEPGGATVEQLAAAVGVTEEAMRKRLLKLGVQLRGRGRPPKS